MLYKTIVLELIQDRPELCSRLRQERLMLQAVETLAVDLKSRHEQWQQKLLNTMRGEAKELIHSRAMEFAIDEAIKMLPGESETADQRTVSMNALIDRVRSHTTST
jgi:hypothetical protein